MKDSVSASGYTSVILVMNMRRFVAPDDHQRFERIRSSPAFLSVLRDQWRERIEAGGTFVHVASDEDPWAFRAEADDDGGISTEEVGFLTGIFRQGALEQYTTPTYRLVNKENIRFPDEILDNIQFKDLFEEPWRNWEVFVRATVHGMLILRLRRAYPKPTPLLTIASDVLRLQMAFDLRSARQKLVYFEQLAKSDPLQAAKCRRKQDSIHHLLRWLGAERQDAADAQSDYVPVQWKLAMEVCRRLVDEVEMAIPLENETIHLRNPAHRVSTPLHDSFVIYHIDELIALSPVLDRARTIAQPALVAANGHTNGSNGHTSRPSVQKAQPAKKLARIEDIYASVEIQNQLIGLIEGAVLKKVGSARENGNALGMPDRSRLFPEHHPAYLSRLLEQNCATWTDELCLLSSRAAIIMPSRQSRPHELFICNFSTTKSRIMYTHYWDALERMIELVVETRVVAQLLERMSSDLLHDFEQETHQIRSGMLNQNVEMNSEALRSLTDRVANLGRMIGVGQSLSTPSVWSRAEFAIQKAQVLLDQQDVPQLFRHTERNVDSLNSLLNHIDELYLADLSEQRNGLASLTSMLLAGLSLIFIFFAIPSFWADSQNLERADSNTIYGQIIPYVTPFGSILAIVLIVTAISLIIYSAMSLNGRSNDLAERRKKRRRRLLRA